MNRKLATIAAFLGAVLWAQSAGAVTISIGTSTDGGGTITNQSSSGTGIDSWVGSAGGFNISAGGQGDPFLGQPAILYSNTIDVATTAGGAVWIYVSASGVTSPSGVVSFLSSFSSNGLGTIALPTGWGIEISTWLNASPGADDPFDTTTPLGVECFGSLPPCGTASSGPLSAGSLYSIVALYKISATGSGSVQSNANVVGASVPLPAALPLLLSTLVGVGFLSRRRGKKAAS